MVFQSKPLASEKTRISLKNDTFVAKKQFAKYFTKQELKDVLNECGFEIDRLEHKYEYSYTAICRKKT